MNDIIDIGKQEERIRVGLGLASLYKQAKYHILDV
jgi:hypothetical protein